MDAPGAQDVLSWVFEAEMRYGPLRLHGGADDDARELPPPPEEPSEKPSGAPDAGGQEGQEAGQGAGQGAGGAGDEDEEGRDREERKGGKPKPKAKPKKKKKKNRFGEDLEFGEEHYLAVFMRMYGVSMEDVGPLLKDQMMNPKMHDRITDQSAIDNLLE